MKEETNLTCPNVLGILRCNWGEVSSITGVAVTPVVGYVGDLSHVSMKLNESEVAEAFTVPVRDVLNPRNWIKQEGSKPDVFVGGRHVVWGLTAFLLGRFVEDVLARYKVRFDKESEEL